MKDKRFDVTYTQGVTDIVRVWWTGKPASTIYR